MDNKKQLKTELKTELVFIENELTNLINELNGLGQILLDGECLQSSYSKACYSLREEYCDKLKNVCYKSIAKLIETDQKRTVELFKIKRTEKCDNISMMPFKSLFLNDKNTLFNISQLGSKWTSELVTKINLKDNTTYSRYLTTIEADPDNGLGSKTSHKMIEKMDGGGISYRHVDFLMFETDEPLIQNDMTFCPEDADEEIDISLAEKIELNKPILLFGYDIQKGYKSPVYHTFPDINFMKNRIEWGGVGCRIT